ncbi:MAG: short-chain fatty acyl-CoA regulator family protein [Parasphingorhabdus sp.]|uniref:helix-turn-helix domain-containing protein n=1 Tax=Parasphingorhabdus sp. TaxID=2709688 RepID=UPI0032969684
MADRKVFAGAAIKRLRRGAGMTQLSLAEALEISPSYLNLIERNRRPLSARLMLLLADRFDFDPRQLVADEPGGGLNSLARRFADPIFADIAIDRTELEEWLTAAPNTVEAFARLFDKQPARENLQKTEDAGPLHLVRVEIERWRNHFADLDSMAETLADELRLGAADLYGAIAERLRNKHQLTIRILPESVLPETLGRLDIHARQFQLSEMLDTASRTFQAAKLLGDIEAQSEIEGLVSGAGFQDRAAERLYQRYLESYFAAALIMPYARFLRACEQTGYQLEILQRRFGASYEQVAHRLTTLQRVGSRGLPFFMIRIDRAGQVSKRFAGASNAPLLESANRCPKWNVHKTFDRPLEVQVQLVGLEDGSTWFTLSRAIQAMAPGAGGYASEYAIGIGLPAEMATTLYHARGLDLSADTALPIGLGCAICTRNHCSQRSVPPKNRVLKFDRQTSGLTPYNFVND